MVEFASKSGQADIIANWSTLHHLTNRCTNTGREFNRAKICMVVSNISGPTERNFLYKTHKQLAQKTLFAKSSTEPTASSKGILTIPLSSRFLYSYPFDLKVTVLAYRHNKILKISQMYIHVTYFLKSRFDICYRQNTTLQCRPKHG